jgi:hypothetical protein
MKKILVFIVATSMILMGATSLINLTNQVTGLLPPVNGGTGLDTHTSTGVAIVSSGTWSISTTPSLGTPSAVVLTNETGMPLACGGIGLGDGVNAISAATYPMLGCVNNSGKTWTIVAIHCYNKEGSSTLDVKNNASTSFFASGPVTCNNTKTSGGATASLGSTTTLATTNALNFTFVADGTTTTTTWTVDFTQ